MKSIEETAKDNFEEQFPSLVKVWRFENTKILTKDGYTKNKDDILKDIQEHTIDKEVVRKTIVRILKEEGYLFADGEPSTTGCETGVVEMFNKLKRELGL